MALILKDRVLETASSPGTGTVTLLGAEIGYQTFGSAIGSGNTTYYTIVDQTGSNWEVGIGTVGSGTLARTTVLDSSNSGSLVNFSTGTQNVFVTYPADKAVNQDASDNVVVPGTVTANSVLLTGNTGTVTSVDATAGTGISVSGGPITSSGSLTITNTAPDQTVVLTGGTGISTSGTYPNFTVTNTAPDQTVAITSGTGISTSGTYPNFTVTNSAPDQTVALTNGTGINVTGTYPNFTIAATNNGTVTSVTGTSPVASSGGATPAISLATAYGDTLNPYASKTANFVLAAPNGSAGVPTFRAIVAADVPTLNQNTTGSAATLTTGRTIAITGDLSYTSPSFNGSGNVTAAGTLATVNANVGSFTNSSVTVNAKGLITAVSSGTAPVTSVTGTSPVVSSGGTTPAISMPAATTSVNGYLTSTDWNTFNNKTSNTGTVTSVGGTGTVSGLSLSGTVTTTGNLTLGGTLAVLPSNFASQTANTILAAPNGTAGAPTFRSIVAADIPTLNQNTTGTASNVTGTVAIANGGTGSTTAANALTALGAYPATNPSGYTSNTGTVTSITAGTGLSGGTITTSGTIAIDSTVATLTGTQTLTNKTVTNLVFDGNFTEEVFTITDGASVDINPANGTIQLWTLGANRTPTATSFAAGQSVTLMIDDGTARTITWTTIGVVWVGGTAPTLALTGDTVIELWKVSTTVYGALVGNVA